MILDKEQPPPFAPADENPPPVYHNDRPPQFETSNSASGSHSQIETMTSLNTSKDKPWLILKVLSKGPSPTLPVVFEGDPIIGTVVLDVDKSEHVEAITIKVVGEWKAAGQANSESYAEGPTLFYSQLTTISTMSIQKLKGHYEWPFSITLPEKIKLKSKSERHDGEITEYPLPPTFTERRSGCHIYYKFTLKLRKGKLRTDVALNFPFIYQLKTAPSPSSHLRQMADSENCTLPGPEVDIEGWENLGLKHITGTLFSSRPVELSCRFYVAKPLCYARGTMIPFRLEFDCRDRQAFDLLSVPKSFIIALSRKVTIQFSKREPGSRHISDDNIETTTAGEGIYWPAEDDDPNSSSRKLNGEIPLDHYLKPTFMFPYTSVEYVISVTITAPGFNMGGENKNQPIFTQKVEIALLLPAGIAPRSRIPSS